MSMPSIYEKGAKARLAPFLSILLLCVLSLCLMSSCTRDDSGLTGFYDTFLALTVKSADEMKIEIEGINKNLTATSMKIAKLDQVGKVCQDWIALQKSNADKELWGPRILGVTADLGKITNDQYRIAKLEFIVEPSSIRKYSSVIMVTDTKTGKQASYDDMRYELKNELDNLKQLAQLRLKSLELSCTTASTVLDQYQTWMVTKANNFTYTVNGPALGYTGTTLAQGQWTYNASTNTITPTDNSSSNLEKIIKGH